MNEVKEFAKEVHMKRREKENRIEIKRKEKNHKEVMNIMNIFHQSTLSNDKYPAVKSITLEVLEGSENLQIMLTTEKGERLDIKNDVAIAVYEAVENVKIPKEMKSDIDKYLSDNLKEYFCIGTSTKATVITLKK